jgi:hypothetical protein
MYKFLEGTNFKYVLLAVVIILVVIIWGNKEPSCSSFSIKIEGVELNMDSQELCNDEQIKQHLDSVFHAGAKFAMRRYKKIVTEQPILANPQKMNDLLLKIENETNKIKITVGKKIKLKTQKITGVF